MTRNDQPGREPDPEIDDMARLLDDVAVQEALEMREAEALEHAPGLQKVERILQATWGESKEPRRSRIRARACLDD